MATKTDLNVSTLLTNPKGFAREVFKDSDLENSFIGPYLSVKRGEKTVTEVIDAVTVEALKEDPNDSFDKFVENYKGEQENWAWAVSSNGNVYYNVDRKHIIRVENAKKQDEAGVTRGWLANLLLANSERILDNAYRFNLSVENFKTTKGEVSPSVETNGMAIQTGPFVPVTS